MSPREPEPDDTALWPAYLAFYRSTVADAVLALDQTERRTSRLPSGWTPIELLSHVLHMERRWFVWIFLGEEVPDRWGDWTVPDPWVADDATGPGARWNVPSNVTAEQLADRLQEVGRRTSQILLEHDLAELSTPGEGYDGAVPTLEWVCFHVLQEYARHAGQLDIVVELGAQNPVMPSP